MTSQTHTRNIRSKHGIARFFGILFIFSALIASALTVILPHGSSAASSTITLTPDADTYVRQSTADSAYATSKEFSAVGGSDTRIAFLRFTVAGIPSGVGIQSAKLRLVVTNDSANGGVVTAMTNSSWAENISWNARPAIDGPQLAQIGAVAVKQAVEADVTAAIKGNGAYSFAINPLPNVTNTVAYAARESSDAATRPQLVITLQGGSEATQPTAQPTTQTQPTTQPQPTAQPTTQPTTQPQPTAQPTTQPQPQPTTPPSSGGSSALALAVQSGPGYLGSQAELVQRAQMAAQNMEPYKSATNDVISFANGKLNSAPAPQEPLNIPGTDGPFVDDTATAYGLALAYDMTGNIKYAQKSRDFIVAWVQKTKTTQNTCPENGSCQTSLVIGRAAPGFIFAAQLIMPSGAFSVADDQAFRSWLRTVILPTASTRTNNWGDAGTFLRASATDYLGDSAGFSAAIAKWKSLVDLIASDGHIPEETRRSTSGINYTQEALDYKIAVAVLAQRRGIDLWSYGRFKQAIDYVAPFVLNPSAWPWAKGATATIHPLWEVAYQHWQSAAYKPIIAQRRPYGADGHSAVRWTTLTNGIPLR